MPFIGRKSKKKKKNVQVVGGDDDSGMEDQSVSRKNMDDEFSKLGSRPEGLNTEEAKVRCFFFPCPSLSCFPFSS